MAVRFRLLRLGNWAHQVRHSLLTTLWRVPVPEGDLRDGLPSLQDILHRLISLFHDPQLHPHCPDLLSRTRMTSRTGWASVSNMWWNCQTSGGTV
jgi:hypothetical protein